MATFLTKLFGNKSDRDLKELNPKLNATLEAYKTIKNLSNDELRIKTTEFKEKIKSAIADDEAEVEAMRNQLDTDLDMPISQKQRLYEQIEKLEDNIYDTTQQVLNELLPEAFAVVKETARRFFENEQVEVTATDFDRDLAAVRESVNISGDKAYFSNSWIAGGTMIHWDMVHYDVQLIGGAVLHEGKIA
ncbi:MAG: preprotein translocase subunit SecA, partial [Bacteroidales bacterium]|nr:preprotein translocase subunit SecA [Bacteroidales bacterium]